MSVGFFCKRMCKLQVDSLSFKYKFFLSPPHFSLISPASLLLLYYIHHYYFLLLLILVPTISSRLPYVRNLFSNYTNRDLGRVRKKRKSLHTHHDDLVVVWTFFGEADETLLKGIRTHSWRGERALKTSSVTPRS
jgi:hypothetical protein